MNIYKSAVLLSAGILVALSLAFYSQSAWPALSSLLAIAIIVAEISVPLRIIDRAGLSSREVNLYAHRLETLLDYLPGVKKTLSPDWPAIKKDLVFSLLFSLIFLLPYSLLYYAYFAVMAKLSGQQLIAHFNLPPRLGLEIISQLLVIALPEEFYYRGFLQSILLKKWPNHTFLAALPMGRAIIITNLIFALGHVVGGFNPARLLTFFPGLIFSALVYQRQNLLPSIIFHAACNLVSQALYFSIFLR